MSKSSSRAVSEALVAANLADRAAADRALAALSRFDEHNLGPDLTLVRAQRRDPARAVVALKR